MKYYLDTEFIEGFHKPLFGKRRHFIDLISIGIVCENGMEYYAISNEFDVDYAWNKFDIQKDFSKPQGLGDKRVYWLRENVLMNLHLNKEYLYQLYSLSWVKDCIKSIGKSNAKISKEITDFIYSCEYPQAETGKQKLFVRMGEIKPQFYGYYADYDWVLFCSLFGTMMDLPRGFPKYCIDLKQEFDNKASGFNRNDFFTAFDFKGDGRGEDLSLEEKVKHLKMHVSYPTETNAHNALDDARWNKKLHEFLTL